MSKLTSRPANAWLAAGALAVATTALAACGDDDSASAEPSVVDITAVDFSFEGVPYEVAVGAMMRIEY